MSSPFKLTDLPNNTWSVTWTENNFAHNAKQRDKLVDILFSEIGCRDVGLGIKLNNGELETLWIGEKEYFQRSDIAHGWEDMYVVRGVVFIHEHEAREFHQLMESRLAWYYLKQGAAVA
jgi:hypothetical protein